MGIEVFDILAAILVLSENTSKRDHEISWLVEHGLAAR
jgi:hypothetical protein